MNREINPSLPPQSDPPTPEGQNFLAQIRQWLTPPVFAGDEDLTRRAAFLNNTLIGAIVISLLYGLSLPFTSTTILPIFVIIVCVLGVLTFGLFNIRRGNVTTTGYILVIFAWILAAISSAIIGGISGPIFSSFAVIIIAAGILLGFRAALVAAAGALGYGLILVFLGNSGLLPTYEAPLTSFYAQAVFTISIVTFLIYLTIRSTTEAITEAKQGEAALGERNAELQNIQTDLANAFEKSTTQLERNKRYLAAAAAIAQSTTTRSQLKVMLNEIVGEIANQFSYYHVGLFLIEENGQWANLEAASSPGGQAMVERSHRLEVGKQGIVGFVTGLGQQRITQDTQLDRIHSLTPELPETRAEMALPLKAHGEIIGALDIQDNVPQAFSEEDIAALQILADQIALAIENLRLTQQAQDRLEEVQRVYGEYSRKAWAETHRQRAISAYKFSDGALTPIVDSGISVDAKNKVEIPIIVRGNQIGSIEIAREDQLAEWTEDEEELLATLSDQLGIALDSARLFNETQLRATTEQIIGNINAEIMESLEINSILRTTVEKIRDTLELPEVSIKMTAAPQTTQQPSSNGNPQDADESK